MPDNVAIISVDGHVKPPQATYRDYLESPYRERFDEQLRSTEGSADGFVHPDVGETAQWDAARRVEDLESQAVVAEVLFPNGQPFDEPRADHLPDRALTRASNMAYNRWLSDFCARAPGRLFGLAAVSFDDIDQATADIRWAKEEGFVGIQMPPLHPGSKYFFDAELDPIWATCQDMELPLCQHGGTGAPDYSPKSFASFMVLATEHWFYSSRSLWQLILGGVFERFPKLKLAMIETEHWWLGPVMDLMDGRETMGDDWSEFAETLGRLKPYKRMPSEYWAENCYAGLSPFSADQLQLDHAGGGFRIQPANAMVGIDYPHPETRFPGTLREVKRLAEHPNITDADVHKVLYENAADVFGIDLGRLASDIDRVCVDLHAVPDLPVPANQATSLFDVVKLTGQ